MGTTREELDAQVLVANSQLGRNIHEELALRLSRQESVSPGRVQLLALLAR